MKAREREYRLLKESTILQGAYMNVGNYEKSVQLQKK